MFRFTARAAVPVETPGARLLAQALTSSLAAAPTRLQAVLVAGSALEGFEGIREAVAEHGHLAAMAHRARNEGKVPTGLAHVGMLNPLK